MVTQFSGSSIWNNSHFRCKNTHFRHWWFFHSWEGIFLPIKMKLQVKFSAMLRWDKARLLPLIINISGWEKPKLVPCSTTIQGKDKRNHYLINFLMGKTSLDKTSVHFKLKCAPFWPMFKHKSYSVHWSPDQLVIGQSQKGRRSCTLSWILNWEVAAHSSRWVKISWAKSLSSFTLFTLIPQS